MRSYTRSKGSTSIRGPSIIDPFGQRDVETIGATVRIFGPIADRVFRYQLRGLQNVPSAPCLLVGNHSGGALSRCPASS